ncbi:MAG: hypothetical protein ACJ76F_08130 [Bacteroidia bacterium]
MNPSLKIWKISVALLTLLNLALLFTIWFKPVPVTDRPGPPGKGGPGNLIIEQLQFSEKQISEFNLLKKAHRDSIEKLQKAGHELRNIFFDELKTDSVDRKKVYQLSIEIANNQKDIELTTFNHFEQVRKLCDEKQKKIFDEIINDVLRKMARGPGKPPPGPHP